MAQFTFDNVGSNTVLNTGQTLLPVGPRSDLYIKNENKREVLDIRKPEAMCGHKEENAILGLLGKVSPV